MKSAPQILKSQVIVHENHRVFFSPHHSLHSQRVCGVTGWFCVNSLRGCLFIHLRFRCGVQMVHRFDNMILWICEFFQLDGRLKTNGSGHLCWVEARVRTKKKNKTVMQRANYYNQRHSQMRQCSICVQCSATCKYMCVWSTTTRRLSLQVFFFIFILLYAAVYCCHRY